MVRDTLLRALAPLIIAALIVNVTDLIRDPVFLVAALLLLLLDRWDVAGRLWDRWEGGS